VKGKRDGKKENRRGRLQRREGTKKEILERKVGVVKAPTEERNEAGKKGQERSKKRQKT
jgi:hypothetical protein